MWYFRCQIRLTSWCRHQLRRPTLLALRHGYIWRLGSMSAKRTPPGATLVTFRRPARTGTTVTGCTFTRTGRSTLAWSNQYPTVSFSPLGCTSPLCAPSALWAMWRWFTRLHGTRHRLFFAEHWITINWVSVTVKQLRAVSDTAHAYNDITHCLAHADDALHNRYDRNTTGVSDNHTPI